MSRKLFTALTAVSFLAACSPKAGDAGTDPAKGSEMAAAPKVPRVMGFEAGRSLDAMGMVSGGVRSTFAPSDTIEASVTTENVGLGGKLEVALMQDTVKVASVEVSAPAPDSTGKAMMGAKLVPAKPLKLGKYELQVLMDGKMAMGKDLEITKSGDPAPEPAPAAAKEPAKAPAKAAAKPKAKSGGE